MQNKNNVLIYLFIQVGIEGITYAGNHGLEILHPDGSKFVHPMPVELEDKVADLLKALQEQVSVISSLFLTLQTVTTCESLTLEVLS